MPSSKLEDYEVLQTIGSGSYGTCRKVRRKVDNKVLVWKELDYGTMTECEKQMLVSEVNLLRELKHPHIVRYYDRIIDRTNTKIYLVMEYCEGGDLGQLISKCKKERKYLDCDFIWKVFFQLVLALQECHKRNNGQHILHRDLKPANVFLDASQNVKLGDFGLARVLSHDMSFAKTFVGTPYYMSPEQMNNTGYNDKSDVWSLGCLIYEVCSLVPPFLAPNQKSLAEKIRVGRFRSIPSHFPDDLNHLISTMLRVSDELRPSVAELAENPVLIRKNKGRKNSHQASDLNWREELLRKKEKALQEKEKDLERREKVLNEQEKILEQKLSRTEILLNELHLERRSHKLDLVKNRYILDKGYQLYNKENGEKLASNRYLEREKPYVTKLSSDLNGDFSRALTRVGTQPNVAVIKSCEFKSHVPYLRMHNLNQPDVQVTKKVAALR